MDITVIFTFLNERECLERLVKDLKAYVMSMKPVSFEVIFVDDGSTDASCEYLFSIPHEGYVAKVIKLSRNFGAHAALRAGITIAKGDYVTCLPADLQDPIEIIGKLYAKCKEGYDVVCACRETAQGNSIERFFSKAYAKLMRSYVVANFPESGYDVVMFNQKIAKKLNENIEAHSSLFLQIFTMGFKQAFINYRKNARVAGRSKWTFSKKMKLVIDSFVNFSYAPIRFVSIIGCTLAGIGFLWMSYIVTRAIVLRDLIGGWPSLIAILMIGFGLTNISLAIIAEYLWRALDVARKRQPFIIDSVSECRSH